jgi:hypothetical protein
MSEKQATRMSAVWRAIYRARLEIVTIGIIYLVSVTLGAIMAHAGNEFALGFRDKLVAEAQRNDPSAIALKEGRALEAAIMDFGRNLFLGALPQTITGLTLVPPYVFAAYRGWVGGIVSVDRRHQSRLSDFQRAFYYLLTLLLQLIPYSLAGGIGVRLGLTYFRQYEEYRPGKKWLGYPTEALLDVARVYALIVPLFLIASLWEFLSPWY